MDRRVLRSRALLQEALLDLARDKRLDEITVADITNRAGVNRSTFYQHYADKDTLLADALEVAVDVAAEPLRDVGPDLPVHHLPPELVTYLLHIAENAPLYRHVLGDHGSAIVAARLRSHVGTLAAEIVGNVVPEGFGVPVDVMGEAFGGTVVGVVTAWVRRDPLPPVAEAAEWLWVALSGPPNQADCVTS